MSDRVCCNCRHNIRTDSDEYAMVLCHCEIDGHYIGYVECMTASCRHWVSDAKYLAEKEIRND